MLLGELLASRCLDVEPPRPSAQQKPRPPGCFRLSGRSLWPGCQDSITALGFLQETEEGLALPPTQDPLALGPCWGPMTLGTLDPLTMARNSKNMQTPVSQKRCSMVPPEGPPAPPQRRPRKQPHPCRGTEKGDPTFQGVTLTFQLKPDCSLQILPTDSSHSQGPPASPASAPEPSPGGSEAQAPRCCASCRTQRTPLWRDAEDGTPLCNACGIRYKKYGTRCSSCWLVPRKSVQPKKLCGRCGLSMDPHQDPTQEMKNIQAQSPDSLFHEVTPPGSAPSPVGLDWTPNKGNCFSCDCCYCY
nr:GATA-type zinc finger protein 1 [Marmota flaviventris]